jgi:hypothetical protein
MKALDDAIQMGYPTPFPAFGRSEFAKYVLARESGRRENTRQRRSQLNIWEEEGGSVRIFRRTGVDRIARIARRRGVSIGFGKPP